MPQRMLASILLCLGLLSQVAYAQPASVSLGERLQVLVAETAQAPPIPGVMAAVRTPDVRWQGAAGVHDTATATPLVPDAPVRIASNTKTFVAVAVLRLWEEGRLGLDNPIRRYLTDEQAALVAGDGYDLDAITVRHLLTHTAGLADHSAAPPYFSAILADPQRVWQPEDQLRGLAEWTEPLGAPGAAFVYSDTGYVLLGELIEQVTGLPLAEAVRDLVGFEQLGLASTWWEAQEEAPEATLPRAHQYVGEQSTHGWNPSLDLYGGGGLVSTVGDQARFWRLLFDGEVFDDAATLDTMLTSPLGEAASYRMGLFVREIDGLRVYEHSGFWGTTAAYVPDLDLSVAVAVTQQQGGGALYGLLRAVIAELAGGSR